MPEGAAICLKCGVPRGQGNHFCPNCGAQTDPQAVVCVHCGAPLNSFGFGQKSRIAAGLLGIFLGGWGVHNFYLGNTSRGVIQIVVTVCTCGVGSVWGLVEGILILTGNINTDANGVPLKD